MYSRALLLASTANAPPTPTPTPPRVELHTTDDAPAQRARRDATPTRHTRYPSASDDDEYPPPSTVSGVPPSASARDGESALTDGASTYVNRAPTARCAAPTPDSYCCAFIDRRTALPPSECAADAHSSCEPSTYRASTAADAFSKRQRSVYASRKRAPSTETRVPPRSGPSGGATPLESSSAW